MSKSSSKKRIIIAASLFAIFLIGAIVSVVVVLAAQTQNVQTTINIAYIVDGVGASVKSSYAIVPIEGNPTEKVAMYSSGEDSINFGVSDQETTANLQPTQNPTLDTTHQQIVFEYYFKNTSDAPFSIELLDSPKINLNGKGKLDNMTESYYVSAHELTFSEIARMARDDSEGKYFQDDYIPQSLTELGSDMYIYILASVENENLNALYEGEFLWLLSKAENTIEITLDYGGKTAVDNSTYKKIKLITASTSESGETTYYMMPCIVKPEVSGEAFAGAYDADGECYIDISGKGLKLVDANITSDLTLTAQWLAGMTISGTTLTAASDDAVDDSGTLTIPEGVTVVGDGTNAVSTTATTVVIPSSVEEIAYGAFASNTTIETVDMSGASSASLAYADANIGSISIGTGAFANCTNLKTVILSDAVTSLGNSAFVGCTLLETINIPEGITELPSLCFSSCTSLKAITLPSALKKIGTFAFDSSGIESITIPASVEEIDSAFTICEKLKTVTFEEGSKVKSIRSFMGCSSLEEFYVPDGVETIGQFCFAGCTSLKKIHIPASVTIIEGNAFVECSSMEEIYLEDLESWLSIDFVYELNSGNRQCSHPFESNYGNTHNNSDAGKYYLNGELLTEINIPTSITDIPDLAFYCGVHITKVTIPAHVKSIGNSSFEGCTKLSDLTLSEGVESIGVLSFCTTAALKSLEMPSSLKNIGQFAFEGSAIEEIYFAEGTETITGTSLFATSKLTTLHLPTTLKSIDGLIFTGCATVTNLHISDLAAYLTVDFINEHPFFYSDPYSSKIYLNGELIENLVIPDGVTRIETQAFAFNGSITSVTFNEELEYICPNAFRSPAGILKAFYANSIEQWLDIVEDMVKDSSSHPFFYTTTGSGKLYIQNELITSIVIPETITKIPDYAFFLLGDNGITSVVIPSSVTEIGIHAFTATGLTSAEFKVSSGWQIYDSASATTGTAITLYSTSDKYSVNADCLIGFYNAKYWKRSDS